MVAYSFQRRFGPQIQAGLGLMPVTGLLVPKRHTIRRDRRRHARPGEEVQLYHGMRTKRCELIGRARCTSVGPIEIHFRRRSTGDWMHHDALPEKMDRSGDLDQFAKSDGFQDWADLRAFWSEEHPGIEDFAGVIIFWEPLTT